MPMKLKKIAHCLYWTGILGGVYLAPGYTADFSHVQRMYVAPSLIHRDLDALGTNNWNIPANSQSPANTIAVPGNASNSANPIDALLSSFGGAAGGGTTALVPSASLAGIDANNMLGNPQYIPSVNKIVAQVNVLLSNGKVAEAENLTRAGLKYFPSSSILKSKFTSITSSEAQVFLAANYMDTAGTKAREALACNSNAKTAKIVEGKVLQAQGLNPNTAEGHVRSGDILSADGRLLEAGVEYKLALNIRPTAEAQVGLGNLALGKGAVVEAGRHYQQALTLDPKSAVAYRQRGALNFVMRDVVSANTDFSKAVALAPDDKLSSEALVGLWKQQVSINPGVNSHLGLARAYMQTNNLDAAKGEYKTVASLDPNNPALPEARRSFMSAMVRQQASQSMEAAKTLEGQGAYNEAQQKLNEALALSPADPQILLYSGKLAQKMGQYQQARDNYMSVLKVDPKNIEAARDLKALSLPFAQASVSNQAPPPALMRLIRPVPFTNNPIINSPINPGSNDIQNVPLKSPLPTKSELLPLPSSNGVCDNSYLRTTDNVYLQPHLSIDFTGESDSQFSIVDSSDEVDSLTNFACALRALMLAQKQVFQLSNADNLR